MFVVCSWIYAQQKSTVLQSYSTVDDHTMSLLLKPAIAATNDSSHTLTFRLLAIKTTARLYSAIRLQLQRCGRLLCSVLVLNFTFDFLVYFFDFIGCR